MPRSVRPAAIGNVASFVAPGGTLLLIAAIDDGAPTLPDGGTLELPDGGTAPWPLTRADIDAFTGHGLEPVRVTVAEVPGDPGERRWLAQFRRP